MEQGNQLLEGAVDSNDRIRMENKANFEAWESKKKQDTEIQQADEWYHGVSDAIGGGKLLGSISSQITRARALNTGISGLVAGDVRSLGQSIKQTVTQPFVSKKPTFQGVEVSGTDKTGDLPSTDESAFQSGETTDIAKTGEEGEGITTKLVGKITGTEGALSSGMSKVLGNIGGGIDVIKDFEGVSRGQDFFSGGKSDATTGDKIANALTVGGSVLDMASMALPFLEPVAGLVNVAGAVDSSVQGISDQVKQQNIDKGNYTKNVQSRLVPPSLSGTGFLASVQTDSHRLIGGSNTF